MYLKNVSTYNYYLPSHLFSHPHPILLFCVVYFYPTDIANVGKKNRTQQEAEMIRAYDNLVIQF